MSDNNTSSTTTAPSSTPAKPSKEVKVVNEEETDSAIVSFFKNVALFFTVIGMYFVAIYAAYNIRLYAIKTYGRVIHEFDPWYV